MKTRIILVALLIVSISFCDKLPNPDITFIDATAEQLPKKDPTSNSMDIEAIDIDKDGDKDFIIASEFRPNLIYINNGKGVFTDETKIRMPISNSDSEDVATGDFDNDGDIDLFFANEDTRIHEYYLNNGKGVFEDVSSRIQTNSKANSVLAGDFDKDGDLDLILGNDGQDIFFQNDGKGHFLPTPERLPIDVSVTQDIETLDIDGDKDLDLIFGNEDGNKVLLNDGKGFFTHASQQLLSDSQEETRKVDIADIDNDGDYDLFFSNVNFRGTKNPSNKILVNNGKGFFTDQTTARYLGQNQFHTADATFADIDKDGDVDLLVANIFGGKQQYFENNGKGVFEERTSSLFPVNPTTECISVEVVDVNMDGLSDIYYGCFRSQDLLLIQKNK